MIVSHKGKLHHLITTPLGGVVGEEWKPELPPVEAELGNSKALINFPKIPYELFRQVAKWQTEIAHSHKCESATSLFLIDGEWQAVPFFQQNDKNSMTIDVNFNSELNLPLIEAMAERSHMGMHATIHNHVSAGAGQSGRDSNDEKNLFGPHITIGNMDKTEMSFHARLSVYIGGKHTFIELSLLDIIESPIVYEGLSQAERERLEKTLLTFNRESVSNYPEEWKDRFSLKVFTPAPVTHHVGFKNQTNFQFGEGRKMRGPEDPDIWDDTSVFLEFPSQVLLHDFEEEYEAWIKTLEKASTSEILKEAVVVTCLSKEIGLRALHTKLKKAYDS